MDHIIIQAVGRLLSNPWMIVVEREADTSIVVVPQH